MNPFPRLVMLIALFSVSPPLRAASPAYDLGKSPRISPQQAAELVAAGKAVLVDVREAEEWAETGVAAPAHQLATTDFRHEAKNWQEFLATVGDRTIITYCLAGVRAGRIADKLAARGFKTANMGRFEDWRATGLPVRRTDEPRR